MHEQKHYQNMKNNDLNDSVANLLQHNFIKIAGDFNALIG